MNDATRAPDTDDTSDSYQRLSVNINSESAEILRQVTTRRGWTTTETIRWALGLLGHFENLAANHESFVSDVGAQLDVEAGLRDAIAPENPENRNDD